MFLLRALISLTICLIILIDSGLGQESCNGHSKKTGQCISTLKCLRESGEHIGTCKTGARIKSCCILQQSNGKGPQRERKSTKQLPVRTTTKPTTSRPTISAAAEVRPPNAELCELGRRRSKRVVGGTVVEDSDHPWAVNLFYKGRKGVYQFCGGTLLKNSWVLTAAHCLKDQNDRKIMASVFNPATNTREIYTPSITLIHPDYPGDQIRHDVGLIKLNIPKSTAENMIPACLAYQRNIAGYRAKVFGWGTQHEEYWNSTSSKSLKAIDVDIFDSNDCFFLKNQFSIFHDEDMVCAGRVERGVDACKGDSGGGLMVGRSVVGVVSWGLGCGRQNRPTVFSRVSASFSWINRLINSF